MRIRWISTILLLSTGCASQPQPAPVVPVATQTAAPRSDSLVATVQEARKAGFDIVDQNGTKLYCREQLKTGSHMRKETICLTAEELRIAREASQSNLEQMKRATPPPRGN